ncbi:YegP family protein [Neptunitalea chrysea]|nr:YegP family protein [Neptunitalea chrysea]
MFKIDKTIDRVYFTLNAEHGKILLTSIPFTNEEDALLASNSCSEIIKKKSGIERKTSSNGKFHFIVKNTDGTILAQSEEYTSEAGMQNNIEAIRKLASK